MSEAQSHNEIDEKSQAAEKPNATTTTESKKPRSGVFSVDLEKVAAITSSDLSRSLTSDVNEFTCEASQEDIALAAALFSRWHSMGEKERNLPETIRYLCSNPETKAEQAPEREYPPAAQFTPAAEHQEQAEVDPNQPKEPDEYYTPSQIRVARALRGKQHDDREIAVHLSLKDADEREKAHLATFQAIYRQDRYNENKAAPVEHFLAELVARSSYWPLELDDIRSELEDLELNLQDQKDVAEAFQNGQAEIEELKKRRPRYVSAVKKEQEGVA